MELRHYARIVLRYWWLVGIVPILVVMGSLLVSPRREVPPQAVMRLAVGVAPEDGRGQFYTFDRYYTWLTAEYLADDLSEILRSAAFAQDVSARLGYTIPPGIIQGATSPQKLHRILSVTVRANSGEEALRIADAIADTLRANSGTYLAQLSAQNAAIAIIDPPALVPPMAGLRERLDFPLRILLALAVGMGLAFLVNYLDETVRDAADAEQLGLRVLAEIPPERRHISLG
jgi:capsular polysaccharide biosynthesis protein